MARKPYNKEKKSSRPSGKSNNPRKKFDRSSSKEGRSNSSEKKFDRSSSKDGKTNFSRKKFDKTSSSKEGKPNFSGKKFDKDTSKDQPKSSGRGRKKFTKEQISRSTIDKQFKNPDAGMRLNKYISNSGICSRRDADIYISAGNVTVNGEVVTEMGYKVQLTDEVRFDGRRINPEKKEYILLNKPSGFYVTGSIEKRNRTVMDLVANATKSRIAPVGKLETSAKGLLLFTNDGTLAKKLARKGIRQIYQVELHKSVTVEDLKAMQEGVQLQEGYIQPIELDYVLNQPNKKILGIELTSTKPQIVQKFFKKFGYDTTNLDRVTYGELTKKNLPRGHYRHLSKQEVINLGML